MASDVFNSFGGEIQNRTPQQQQNPKDMALNMLRQQGFNIPQGYENDPNYLTQMVLNSNNPQYRSRLPMARNAIMQLIGRR